jgi:hypothetical protein
MASEASGQRDKQDGEAERLVRRSAQREGLVPLDFAWLHFARDAKASYLGKALNTAVLISASRSSAASGLSLVYVLTT